MPACLQSITENTTSFFADGKLVEVQCSPTHYYVPPSSSSSSSSSTSGTTASVVNSRARTDQQLTDCPLGTVSIGSDDSSASGSMVDLKIFPRALSEIEIDSIFKTSLPLGDLVRGGGKEPTATDSNGLDALRQAVGAAKDKLTAKIDATKKEQVASQYRIGLKNARDAKITQSNITSVGDSVSAASTKVEGVAAALGDVLTDTGTITPAVAGLKADTHLIKTALADVKADTEALKGLLPSRRMLWGKSTTVRTYVRPVCALP
jgi:hypothetical protein